MSAEQQAPNMMEQSFYLLSQATAHLGVMREHMRQMAANHEDDTKSDLYRKAAIAQATQSANCCEQVHTALSQFIFQMSDKPRIVTPR
jgi:hypothetical protein